MNLIAIAIILQMTNNKESIIQRMISEVKSTKLLWEKINYLQHSFAAAQPTICKLHISYHSHRNLNINHNRKKSKEFYKNH